MSVRADVSPGNPGTTMTSQDFLSDQGSIVSSLPASTSEDWDREGQRPVLRISKGTSVERLRGGDLNWGTH